jgi:hypothetical protein
MYIQCVTNSVIIAMDKSIHLSALLFGAVIRVDCLFTPSANRVKHKKTRPTDTPIAEMIHSPVFGFPKTA